MAQEGDGKSMFSDRKAHFFKVLLGNFAERLMIPPNFMKHISGENMQKAILQGPSCKKWHVELVRLKGGTFLLNGWQKFVKDNSLRDHEFLVFRYDGDMHFTVSVFGTSACERDDLFVVGMQKGSKLFEERDSKVIATKQSLGICSLADKEAEEIDFAASLVKTEMFEEYEFKPLQIDRCDSFLEKQIPTSRAPVRRHRFGPKSRPVTTEESLKAQEAANSFTSSHPFTIVCMKPREVYYCSSVRLPVVFSKKYLPRRRTDMVLHVASGKSWMVSFLPKARNMLSKGMAAFIRGNNIMVGDYCIFELVGPTKFQVHIIRVDPEIVPAIKNTLEDAKNVTDVATAPVDDEN